jgi:HEAT repeat protein
MSRYRSIATTLAVAGAFWACAPPATAHGGSHPTPFPNPTPVPSWPTPTYVPPGPNNPDAPTRPGAPTQPTPPAPLPPTTTQRPGPGTPRPPGTPSGPVGPARPTPPTGPKRPRPKASGPDGRGWETWWHLNQWQYLRVQRVGTQTSGGDAPDTPAGTGTVGNSKLFEFLIEQSSHKYFDIRAASCIAIGRAGTMGMAGFLQPKAHDPNLDVRESALLGMGLLGSPIPVMQMQMILRDPTTPNRLRASAALGLGFTKDQSAIPALRKLLSAPGEDDIRAAAALALGFAGGASERDLLLRVAANQSQDKRVRSYAIGAAGRIAHRLRGNGGDPDPTSEALRRLLLGDRSDEVRRAAVLALGHIGDPDALPAVLKAWANDTDSMTERFAMLTAAQLARGRTEATTVFARLQPILAGRGTAGERGFAALATGLLRHSKGGPALLKMLGSAGAQKSQAAACVGLGLMRYTQAHAALAKTAAGRGAPKVRGYAALAVGMVGHEEASKTLQMLLSTVTIPEIRGSAAVGLGLTGTARGTAQLLTMLKGGNTYVRMTTAVALGFLRDETAIQPILQRFKTEPSNEVKALLVAILLAMRLQ